MSIKVRSAITEISKETKTEQIIWHLKGYTALGASEINTISEKFPLDNGSSMKISLTVKPPKSFCILEYHEGMENIQKLGKLLLESEGWSNSYEYGYGKLLKIELLASMPPSDWLRVTVTPQLSVQRRDAVVELPISVEAEDLVESDGVPAFSVLPPLPVSVEPAVAESVSAIAQHHSVLPPLPVSAALPIASQPLSVSAEPAVAESVSVIAQHHAVLPPLSVSSALPTAPQPVPVEDVVDAAANHAEPASRAVESVAATEHHSMLPPLPVNAEPAVSESVATAQHHSVLPPLPVRAEQPAAPQQTQNMLACMFASFAEPARRPDEFITAATRNSSALPQLPVSGEAPTAQQPLPKPTESIVAATAKSRSAESVTASAAYFSVFPPLSVNAEPPTAQLPPSAVTVPLSKTAESIANSRSYAEAAAPVADSTTASALTTPLLSALPSSSESSPTAQLSPSADPAPPPKPTESAPIAKDGAEAAAPATYSIFAEPFVPSANRLPLVGPQSSRLPLPLSVAGFPQPFTEVFIRKAVEFSISATPRLIFRPHAFRSLKWELRILLNDCRCFQSADLIMPIILRLLDCLDMSTNQNTELSVRMPQILELDSAFPADFWNWSPNKRFFCADHHLKKCQQIFETLSSISAAADRCRNMANSLIHSLDDLIVQTNMEDIFHMTHWAGTWLELCAQAWDYFAAPPSGWVDTPPASLVDLTPPVYEECWPLTRAIVAMTPPPANAALEIFATGREPWVFGVSIPTAEELGISPHFTSVLDAVRFCIYAMPQLLFQSENPTPEMKKVLKWIFPRLSANQFSKRCKVLPLWKRLNKAFASPRRKMNDGMLELKAAIQTDFWQLTPKERHTTAYFHLNSMVTFCRKSTTQNCNGMADNGPKAGCADLSIMLLDQVYVLNAEEIYADRFGIIEWATLWFDLCDLTLQIESS